eukprot:TRINITY_DN32971_c0_g1_i1.p2 TRINITY_DN32971_c0_g1~~TRINITY_DN32971_c0_g1_i1.p2  ORF type:complete len:420 (+),score=66.82 TRINITY_DN32971_c0_g1_i1:122-1261(+)
MAVAAIVFLLCAGLASATAPPAGCTRNTDCGANTYDYCCVGALRRQFNGTTVSGLCIDSRWQECCVNTACSTHYQSCCNDTCCGSDSSCRVADTVEGARDTCSTIEHFDVRRGFLSIGFPVILCVGVLAAVLSAIVLIRLVRVRLTSIAVLLLLTALAIALFATCMLVSPVVLPMFFVAVAASVAIAALGAARRNQRPEVVVTVALTALLGAFLLMINPFASNSLLSSGPAYSTTGGEARGGVIGALMGYLAEHDMAVGAPSMAGAFSSCTDFYQGYWRRDPALYADSRMYDPIKGTQPFGLCSREYLTWQLFNALIVTGLLPVLGMLLVARLWEVRQVHDETEGKPDVVVVDTETPARTMHMTAVARNAVVPMEPVAQ